MESESNSEVEHNPLIFSKVSVSSNDDYNTFDNDALIGTVPKLLPIKEDYFPPATEDEKLQIAEKERLDTIIRQYDEEQAFIKSKSTGKWYTAFSLMKAIVGAGSFSFPWAFMHAGLILSMFGLVLFALLCIYTIRMLLDVKRHLFPNLPMMYSGLVEEIFGYRFGIFASVCAMTISIGAGTAYFDFIGCVLHTFFPSLTMISAILIITPFFCLIGLLRSPDLVAKTALIGLAGIFLGLGCVMVYGFKELKEFPSDLTLINFSDFPLFIGSVLFLFCIHYLIFPIESGMKDPSSFKGTIDLSFLITGLLNLVFGFCGYIFFLEDTNSVVIVNVEGDAFVTFVKICLIIDLLFTYAIVLAPTAIFLEHLFLPYGTTQRKLKTSILRIILALSSAFFAVLLPNFGFVITLVGGFSSTLLSFVIPPFIYLKVFWNETGLLKKLFLFSISLLGVIIMISTFYVTILHASDEEKEGFC